MSALVDFEAPVRTVSALNEREHWAAKARRVKRERKTTALALQLGPGWVGRAACRGALIAGRQLVVALERRSRGELDDDNLRAALKGVRDEIAAWLGVDDRDPRVEWRYAQRRAQGFAVRIRIEREDSCPE